MWCVPSESSPIEMMTTAAKMGKKLESRLPEYHTRQMKREFQFRYRNIAGTTIPPHILRNMYAELILDASSNRNPSIDGRLKHAILSGDSDVAVDLRHLNVGRPDDSFEVFFQTFDQELEFVIGADERRHYVEHFRKFLSVRDLIE